MNKRLKELGVSTNLKIDVQKVTAMANKKLDAIPSERRTFIKYKPLKLIAIAACVAVIGLAAIAIAERREDHVFQIPKTEIDVSDIVSEEYYAARDKQEGMKLYVSAKNNFYIQVPENAFVSEGVHIDEITYTDTCTIRFNNCFLSVVYDYALSGDRYTTLDEVINAFAEDGITLQGEVKDFEIFRITDDINGYKFCQYVSEKRRIEYIHYYTPSGEVGIVVQVNSTNSDDEMILSKSLNSILIK